jgi:hypothetical protein
LIQSIGESVAGSVQAGDAERRSRNDQHAGVHEGLRRFITPPQACGKYGRVLAPILAPGRPALKG